MKTSHPTSLGDFIRTRRDRLSPEQVGLHAASRRRAKGLRREELAALCGISPTWLTWIEQGRTTSVSAQAVSRIGEALLLTKTEREYLFELAGVRDPSRIVEQTAMDLGEILAEAVARIQTPAYVLDRGWNVIAWNAEAANLFLSWLGKKASSPNLLQYMFLNPEARAFIADWPLRAQRLVAEFRNDCRAILDEEEIKNRVAELRQKSEQFETFWSAHDVVEREGGERVFLHPERGKITLRQLTLRLTHSPNMKLVILL